MADSASDVLVAPAPANAGAGLPAPAPVNAGAGLPAAPSNSELASFVQTFLRAKNDTHRGEVEVASQIVQDPVAWAEEGVAPVPAFVDDGKGRELELTANGVPKMAMLKQPLPEYPYLMDPERAPGYAISAFTPLWKELKTSLSAMHNVINGFRVLITKWNNNEGMPETHVALNQGKLHVPWGKMLRMLHAGIALSLQSGKDCWITELKTPWFRFFSDFDFVQPEKLTCRQIEALVFVVQRAVRRFFPNSRDDDDKFIAIVCSTGYKPIYASKEEEKKVALGLVAQQKLAEGGHLLSEADRRTLQKQVDAMPKPVAWKTGVHTLWTSLFVNNDMALIMRETVIHELAEAFGMRVDAMNDWTDVVDVTVYKGSGLRMVGNRKSDICPQCKVARRVGPPEECIHCPESSRHHCTTELHWVKLNKKDAAAHLGVVCPTCNGNGRVDTGRPYMPMFVVDANGMRRPELERIYQTDFVRLINDTSIRWQGVPWKGSDAARTARAKLAKEHADDAEALKEAVEELEDRLGKTYVYEQPQGQRWVVYKGAPLPVSLKLVTGPDGLEHYVEEEAGHRPVKKKSKGGATAEDSVTARALAGGGEPKGMSIVLPRADDLTFTLQAFIRTHAGSLYDQLRVTRVATNKDRTCYFVNVQGPNCNYCHNVGKEHGSNRVYFMFANEGMVQRCHKRGEQKPGETIHGPCATYRSAPTALPHELKVRLFPKVAAKAEESGAMGLITGSGYAATVAMLEDDATLGLETAAVYDPMRDTKALDLLNMGDKLSMSLHGTPWSNTLEACEGRHIMGVPSSDLAFVQRSSMLTLAAAGKRANFMEADFAGLGQRAAAFLKEHGFAAEDRAEAKTKEGDKDKGKRGREDAAGVQEPLAKRPRIVLDPGDDEEEEELGSSIADAVAGGYESDDGERGEEPVVPVPSIQRLHALLVKQFGMVVDAAVALPAAVVAECLQEGGCTRLVEMFRSQRNARPPAAETIQVRLERTIAKATQALVTAQAKEDEANGMVSAVTTGAALAIWITANEDARNTEERRQLDRAQTHWKVYLTDHPTATPEQAVKHVKHSMEAGKLELAAIAAAKGPRREFALLAAIAPRPAARTAMGGPKMKGLREIEADDSS